MKTLLITPGDPEGIGPEVTAKALHFLAKKQNSKLKSYQLILFAKSGVFDPFRRELKPLMLSSQLKFSNPPENSLPGFQAGWAIQEATQIALKHPKTHALVTGPIHKKRLNEGGFKFKGHTDFLAKLCNSPAPTMMLANEHFRVALVTQHCSLKSVSAQLSKQNILKAIGDTASFLKNQLHIKKPKITVLALNPHAGEGGLLGNEESKIIRPAILNAQQKFDFCAISGPFPADSFFGIDFNKKARDRADAIVAMYHDQGLIPIKLLGFHSSINLTLGLPIFRSSVDHGTAFDQVGKNTANCESMILAIESAMSYLNRKAKIK